ncbi:ribokinase [Testudinibacter sp. TR-2022]|uniref:ribokinase n=1 Tax=Testudinibacter sp. TR-2022 TaxID=2585029 RepID=UPI0011187362|nr:ribokinase [Testudinibacter sp. TR-2022]TNH05074.1 ribokinase [Pasteurellaceae bacterium Phil31]TNH08982.1 ribokinase [Testudinibacter sp. TR-2022]TNH10659.1 ribokinase [Testudinibacter sp. TR-2022]TNH17201.1 ribokinase [Testudinibacter sp. TR-2022]TNH20763.1 ribokinase [Testudinibacter sp. TR-2022]
MDIAVIGSNMVDLITYVDQMPKAGETLEAPTFQMGCGGKGANQAIAAARTGASVMMLSKVGDDIFAENTLRNFQQNGIDTLYVEKVSGVSSGVAPIFVDSSSQNRILIIKGANAHLKPEDIDRAAAELQQCKLIILQLEIPLETVYYAIDFANRYGIQVILNPAPASKALSLEYACKCDFFMPNETELEILTGMPVANMEQIQAAAHFLLEKGLKNLIVTLGDKGSVWLYGDQIVKVPPCKVNAVDTSGAGDAFIGCFAQHYIHSGNVLEAMQQASLYAAYSVTGKGTQSSYPDQTQFNLFKQAQQ